MRSRSRRKRIHCRMCPTLRQCSRHWSRHEQKPKPTTQASFGPSPSEDHGLLHTWGVAQDAWRSQAVGRDCKEFCQNFSLQDSARFDTSLYGHDGALVMARYWVARMDFFRSQWLLLGALVPCHWLADLLGRFVEPTDFFRLASSLALPPRAKARVDLLRHIALVGVGAQALA